MKLLTDYKLRTEYIYESCNHQNILTNIYKHTDENILVKWKAKCKSKNQPAGTRARVPALFIYLFLFRI